MRQTMVSRADDEFDTRAVHAGRAVDPATGAVAPAIQPTTTFERAADGSYPHGHYYARVSNPNRAALEQLLASLEGGVAAAAFGSGSAAALAVFQALAPGDHVVCTQDAYHGIQRELRELMARWGLVTTFVDASDLDAVRAAFTPATRLLWLETPSNPLLRITDIAGAAAIAHERGACVVVDNTFATPVLQLPFTLGADLVMHSTTKYLGGHSDVTGGAIVTREDSALFARVRAAQTIGGSVPSAFDCWLLARGAATLGVRVRAQCVSAARIAGFLAEHPAVHAVHYPGLPGHPGHALALRQMRAPGAMIAFQVRGGEAVTQRMVGSTRLFTRATSLGSVESLIEHRASMEGPESKTPRDLVRLSIGLESATDLIADLEQALAAARQES
jgi:cystathionine gamma-synthase